MKPLRSWILNYFRFLQMSVGDILSILQSADLRLV